MVYFLFPDGKNNIISDYLKIKKSYSVSESYPEGDPTFIADVFIAYGLCGKKSVVIEFGFVFPKTVHISGIAIEDPEVEPETGRGCLYPLAVLVVHRFVPE